MAASRHIALLNRPNRRSSVPPPPHLQSRGQEQVTQLNTPLHTDATKVYFKLLQAVHHSEIVKNSLETKAYPKGMVHKINKMTTFIKPGSPNLATFQRVQQNTDDWIHNNFVILRDHYEQVISHNLLNLPQFQLEAYNRALKWSRARYGRKLTPSSIEMLRAMIMTTSSGAPSTASAGFQPQEEDFPPLPPPAVPIEQLSNSPLPQRSLRHQRSNLTRRRGKISPSESNQAPNSTPESHVNTLIPLTSPMDNPAQLSLSRSPEPPVGDVENSAFRNSPLPPCLDDSAVVPVQKLKTTNSEIKHPIHNSFNIAVAKTFHSNVAINIPDSIDFATPSQELTVTRQPQPTFQAALKEPVIISAPATEVKVLIHLPVNPNQDTVHLLIPSCTPTADEVHNSQPDFRDETKPPQLIASTSTITPQRKESGVRQDKEKLDFYLENKDLTSGLTDPPLHTVSPLPDFSTPRPLLQQISTETTSTSANPMTSAGNIAENGLNKVDSPARSEDVFALPSGSSPNFAARREPHRHITTNRKLKDWSVKIIKPIVILGDSNLSRIPHFEDPKIQIDSFPGAGIHHIQSILKGLKPHKLVKEVILSVGLNNCLGLLLPNTTDKQLGLLVTSAKRAFPNAIIRIPVINFSTKLGKEQQHLITLLNKTIISKYNFLTEISPLTFRVGDKDPVHWTPMTARRIFGHWTDQLNM